MTIWQALGFVLAVTVPIVYFGTKLVERLDSLIQLEQAAADRQREIALTLMRIEEINDKRK